MSESILVVAVHPDDETLGCGGTLLRFHNSGAEIHWMIVTSMKPHLGFSSDKIEQRDREILQVAQMYNFSSVHSLGFPTTQLDTIPMSELISAISNVFKTVKPTQVFLPFLHDVHSDHQQAFSAAFSCSKTFRYPSIRKVLMMETLSETDFSFSYNSGFIPNLFINVSDFIERKIDIMKVYSSEILYHPFPRSIETIQALALLRGAASGCKYAESFIILKEIL
jgi:LmbE family N-acetylglucosaminyl deacetylase